MNIVLRILWKGGVTRVALEEAKLIPAKLIVYRREKTNYDLSNVDLQVLFEGKPKWIYTFLTSIYAKQRGSEATVDLDRIINAKDLIKGPSLFHDQFAGLTGYLRKKSYGEDYAVYIHETSLDNQGVKWTFPKMLEKKILKESKIIITNSYWNKKIMEEHGFSSEVVYPGCYPKDKINVERENIVLTVSLWDKGRKPEIYGEIAKRIKGKIIMAGSWVDDTLMNEFKRKYPEVMVTGPLPEGDLQKLYDRASVFIRFGYHEKGPGLGVLEAMASGMPVIVNDGLGSKELIKDNGFVVKDWTEAVDKINEILNDDNLRREFSKNSWEIAKSLHWKNHAEKVKELMSKLE
ncbi:glycosyltransferase family 4 protein [Sulfurisphaera javensis]|uniref:Glycosyltransferase family 4 protein n=1 Tax=Sulfurisphaera javensis TaxID=2049879 RepID=A0AAT9GMR6_9CREN